jgi:Xaa-Pro dipeptidase
VDKNKVKTDSAKTTLFPQAEYLQRIHAAKQRMIVAGIDLLVVVVPENIYYLCGYAGWSFYTPQALLLHVDATEPTLIVREMDVACAEVTAFIKPQRQIGYPENYIGSVSRHPMQFIGDYIRKSGWHRQRIGLEKDSAFFSVTSYETLTGSLSDASFVDADLLVTWVRTVKSDAEIEFMRQAGVLAACAMQAAVDAIAPGVRECDAAAALYRAQLRGTSQFGGSVPNSVLMPAGPKTRAPLLKWSDEPYRRGESVNIELSGCRHQYHCGLARTVSLGPPHADLVKLAVIVTDGLNAALSAVRPGVRCEEVVAAWTATISKAG